MSLTAAPRPPTTLRALWRRAPLWRFFALSAPFLTALFLLFPPDGRSPADLGSQSSHDRASYTPVAPLGGDAGGGRQPTLGASERALPVTAAIPEPRPAAPARPAERALQAAPPNAASVAPKTAQLSMVTAGPPEKPNGTGLDSAMLGTLYAGTITSTGFTLPLPPGQWAVLARSGLNGPRASGMAFYLGKIEGKRLVGAVKLFALKVRDGAGQGFPEAKACSKPNPFVAYVFIEGEIVPSEHQACWLTQNYYAEGFRSWADRGVPMGNIDRAAGGDLAAKGVSYPQDFVDVRFTRSDKSHLLEADYMFSPDAAGISSRPAPSAMDSEWSAANVKRSPEKVAYMEKMKAWGEAFWPRFKDAFSQAAGTPTP